MCDRDIESILRFRLDLSPFLVHLTRDTRDDQSAKDNLKRILSEKRIVCSDKEISDARYGMNTTGLTSVERSDLFSAICFTETPLSEIHSLLEISYRGIDLKPYGLAFVKKRLMKRGVSPVVYINNKRTDADTLFQALCGIRQDNLNEAKKILPLIAVFGKKIKSPTASSRSPGDVDFIWEREWRLPKMEGDLAFTQKDVFIGFCPEEDIQEFDELEPEFEFIDPRWNAKWYAEKLIRARQRLKLKHSVV